LSSIATATEHLDGVQPMRWLGATWTRLLCEQPGATMVEYAFMVLLIALVCITAVTLIGVNLAPLFNSAAAGL
jgi:Flp pilus assembly pilin Flp